MANGYTALYGSAFEKVERQLLADGYVCAFACTYGEPAGPVPKDLEGPVRRAVGRCGAN